MAFSNNLKNLRLSYGYTQKDICAILNLSQNGYASWEQGRTEPNLENLKMLCKIFNVTTDYLLGLSDDDNVVVNNELSESENYLINKFRSLNNDNKNEVLNFVNYMAYKKNSRNYIDISGLDELSKADALGYIKGLQKNIIQKNDKRA